MCEPPLRWRVRHLDRKRRANQAHVIRKVADDKTRVPKSFGSAGEARPGQPVLHDSCLNIYVHMLRFDLNFPSCAAKLVSFSGRAGEPICSLNLELHRCLAHDLGLRYYEQDALEMTS